MHPRTTREGEARLLVSSTMVVSSPSESDAHCEIAAGRRTHSTRRTGALQRSKNRALGGEREWLHQDELAEALDVLRLQVLLQSLLVLPHCEVPRERKAQTQQGAIAAPGPVQVSALQCRKHSHATRGCLLLSLP